MLRHLTLELATALDFNFRIIQIARNTAAAVDQNMIVANDVFSQNTMNINDLRVDLSRHTAFGAYL